MKLRTKIIRRLQKWTNDSPVPNHFAGSIFEAIGSIRLGYMDDILDPKPKRKQKRRVG